MAKPDITAARLREILHYDPETGVFTNLVQRGNAKPGIRLGSITPYGYSVIPIYGTNYMAHRLAWLYVHGTWPDADVDHINGSRADNRLGNLRDVSREMNLQNIKCVSKAVSGFRCVYPTRDPNRWYAQISVKNKIRHLGTFGSREEASAAYIDAKRRLHDGCTI